MDRVRGGSRGGGRLGDVAHEIAGDLRSALALIDDVLGDLEQRVDAGAAHEV